MKLSVVYFSPTGGTRKACMNLAAAMAAEDASSGAAAAAVVPGEMSAEAAAVSEAASVSGASAAAIREVDLSHVDAECVFGPEDTVIVGMPVFGGRIPAFGAGKLKLLKGNGAAAVTAAVYGNRAFEDALLELGDSLKEQGFKIAAGTALLAEHSMARDIGAGRPDEEDKEDMKSFAARICEKLKMKGRREPEIPGDRPYREWKQMPVTPRADDSCTACGLCAGQCPAGAIPADAPGSTMAERCILCMRCVSVCPVRARSLPEPALAMLAQKLSAVRDIRRENELFL